MLRGADDGDCDERRGRESDHWLDFPITHVEILWSLLKQLWIPNLFRYTITRARYSSMGHWHDQLGELVAAMAARKRT